MWDNSVCVAIGCELDGPCSSHLQYQIMLLYSTVCTAVLGPNQPHNLSVPGVNSPVVT
jgi:hypothetical protein